MKQHHENPDITFLIIFLVLLDVQGKVVSSELRSISNSRLSCLDHQAGRGMTLGLPCLPGERWQEGHKSHQECSPILVWESGQVRVNLIMNHNWQLPSSEQVWPSFSALKFPLENGNNLPLVGCVDSIFEAIPCILPCRVFFAFLRQAGSLIWWGPDLSCVFPGLYIELALKSWGASKAGFPEGEIMAGVSCTWTCFDCGTKYIEKCSSGTGSPPHSSWLWVLISNWNLSSYFTFGQTGFFGFLFFLLFL